MKAKLILENGAVFQGESFGAVQDRVCELVFNTSMVGYQEILTDPSCIGQGIVMTYPLIGNYGVNSEDVESGRCWAEALIVRRVCPRGSNFRCEKTLDAYMADNYVTGICGVDTRALTRILRDQGSMNGLITTRDEIDKDEAMAQLKNYRVSDCVKKVTRQKAGTFTAADPTARVAIYDFGVKNSLIRELTARGCSITVFPAYTPAQTVLEGGYDGVLLSNGPGDPHDAACTLIVEEIRKLFEAQIPTFGIGLGHQLLALANGAESFRMRYGHHGNQSVRELSSGRVYITAQGHGYTIQPSSINTSRAQISYVNANDGSVEGLEYGNAFSVQFYPETIEGPASTGFLFDRFINMMGGNHRA